jgi:hypothetical protein
LQLQRRRRRWHHHQRRSFHHRRRLPWNELQLRRRRRMDGTTSTDLLEAGVDGLEFLLHMPSEGGGIVRW